MAMENSLYMWFLKIIGNYGKNLYKWRFLAKIIETLAGGFSTFHKPGGALARAGYTHREGHGKPETYHDWGVRVAIKRVTWIDLGDGFLNLNLPQCLLYYLCIYIYII